MNKTDNTNSKHLELYTILGEYDNTGFPLSYCLLTTASSVEEGKRLRALEAWAMILRDKYGVAPRFVHTDKDMAEIGASRRTWKEAKHQLCWWHVREALKRRLKGNLPTSVYHPLRAVHEYPFISPTFKPYGRADPDDTEGRDPGEASEHGLQYGGANMAQYPNNPNSIKIRISVPTSQSQNTSETIAPVNTSNSLTIRIPPLSTICKATDNEPDEEEINGRHTFCPMEYRAVVIDLMERHFCTHPLIPGFSTPTLEGIKAWAVKQMYQFCVRRDLPNLWAYLWENWYRRNRWELWARCGAPEEIPRLKTTMIVEAQ
jgi:hypothetical protein